MLWFTVAPLRNSYIYINLNNIYIIYGINKLTTQHIGRYVRLQQNKIRLWNYLLGKEEEDFFGQVFYQEEGSNFINAVFESSRFVMSKDKQVFINIIYGHCRNY